MSKFCSSCGAEINEKAVLCVKCGVPVPGMSLPGAATQIDPSTTSTCSRVTYVILAIILGEFGIHNFYAGHTMKAVIQLLVTVLLFELVFPIFIIIAWVIYEAFTVTTDGKGQPFR